MAEEDVRYRVLVDVEEAIAGLRRFDAERQRVAEGAARAAGPGLSLVSGGGAAAGQGQAAAAAETEAAGVAAAARVEAARVAERAVTEGYRAQVEAARLAGREEAAAARESAAERKEAMAGVNEAGKAAFGNLFGTVLTAALVVEGIKSVIEEVIHLGEELAKEAIEASRAERSLTAMATTANLPLGEATAQVHALAEEFHLSERAATNLYTGVLRFTESAHRVEQTQGFFEALGKALVSSGHSLDEMDAVITRLQARPEMALKRLFGVDAKDVLADYAAALGTTADKLDLAEQRQAAMVAVMELAKDRTVDLNAYFQAAAGRSEALAAEWENLKEKLGLAIVNSETFSRVLAQVSDLIVELDKHSGDLTRTLADLEPTLRFITQWLVAAAALLIHVSIAIKDLANGIEYLGVVAKQAVVDTNPLLSLLRDLGYLDTRAKSEARIAQLEREGAANKKAFDDVSKYAQQMIDALGNMTGGAADAGEKAGASFGAGFITSIGAAWQRQVLSMAADAAPILQRAQEAADAAAKQARDAAAGKIESQGTGSAAAVSSLSYEVQKDALTGSVPDQIAKLLVDQTQAIAAFKSQYADFINGAIGGQERLAEFTRLQNMKTDLERTRLDNAAYERRNDAREQDTIAHLRAEGQVHTAANEEHELQLKQWADQYRKEYAGVGVGAATIEREIADHRTTWLEIWALDYEREIKKAALKAAGEALKAVAAVAEAALKRADRAGQGTRRDLTVQFNMGQEARDVEAVGKAFGFASQNAAILKLQIKAIQDIQAGHFGRGIVEGLKAIVKETLFSAQAFEQMGASIGNAILGVIQHTDTFGNAIKKFFLGLIGDLAIQFGGFLILVGTGMATVGVLFGLSGGAAIAAGIALIAFGTVMKGLAAGASQAAGSSGAAAGDSGGGAGSSGGSSPSKIHQIGFPTSGEQPIKVEFSVSGNSDPAIKALVEHLVSKGVITVKSAHRQHRMTLKKAVA